MSTTTTVADVNELSTAPATEQLQAEVDALIRAVRDRRLTRTELRVFAKVNQIDPVTADRSEIADSLGITPKAVSKSLSLLRRYEYLERSSSYLGSNDEGIAALVWDKTGGLCTYCNRKLHPFKRRSLRGFHIDHWMPRSRGGSDDIANLVPSCRACNLEKNTKTGEEYQAVLAARRAA